MKILMVSMPCLHFFRWTEQLQDAGHEIFWFDVTDGGEKVERLHWAKQVVGWKFRWNYPGRVFVKINFPKVYNFIQKFNERNTLKVFEKKLLEIQPDIVHSFELQISCISILPIMLKYKNKKWIYSSWGSDVFYFEKLNIEEKLIRQILGRIDFLISDCKRDYEITKKLGFRNQFLGVFPGNGGIDFPLEMPQLFMPKDRDTILIKAYNEGFGRGIDILKSFDSELIDLLMKFEVVLFGANQEIIDYIEGNDQLKKINFIIYSKNRHINNEALLRLMNKSCLYIANSLSDGLPNALLEAMGMGAFPIQSNPGNVSEEVITHGINGFLIANPLDKNEIANWIKKAIQDEKLRKEAQNFNVKFIREKYNRKNLRKDICELYQNLI
jgi:glycosyltransferase involved in cell wall biosynthesis